MARPKGTAPVKGKINLTVSDQTKAELHYIAQISGKSVSELVAEWAAKAAKKAAKAHPDQPYPDADQTSLPM